MIESERQQHDPGFRASTLPWKDLEPPWGSGGWREGWRTDINSHRTPGVEMISSDGLELRAGCFKGQGCAQDGPSSSSTSPLTPVQLTPERDYVRVESRTGMGKGREEPGTVLSSSSSFSSLTGGNTFESSGEESNRSDREASQLLQATRRNGRRSSIFFNVPRDDGTPMAVRIGRKPQRRRNSRRQNVTPSRLPMSPLVVRGGRDLEDTTPGQFDDATSTSSSMSDGVPGEAGKISPVWGPDELSNSINEGCCMGGGATYQLEEEGLDVELGRESCQARRLSKDNGVGALERTPEEYDREAYPVLATAIGHAITNGRELAPPRGLSGATDDALAPPGEVLCEYSDCETLFGEGLETREPHARSTDGHDEEMPVSTEEESIIEIGRSSTRDGQAKNKEDMRGVTCQRLLSDAKGIALTRIASGLCPAHQGGCMVTCFRATDEVVTMSGQRQLLLASNFLWAGSVVEASSGGKAFGGFHRLAAMKGSRVQYRALSSTSTGFVIEVVTSTTTVRLEPSDAKGLLEWGAVMCQSLVVFACQEEGKTKQAERWSGPDPGDVSMGQWLQQNDRRNASRSRRHPLTCGQQLCVESGGGWAY
ncbi:unnamed protein product [Discosporangium mesarthrocarpum]